MSREIRPKVGTLEAVYAVLMQGAVKGKTKVLLFDKDFQHNRTVICDPHGEPLGVTYLKTAETLSDARDAGLLDGTNTGSKPLRKILRSCAQDVPELTDV